jgi:hypothetical protein
MSRNACTALLVLVTVVLLSSCASIGAPPVGRLHLGMGRDTVDRMARLPDELLMFAGEEGGQEELWTFYAAHGQLLLYFRDGVLAGVKKTKE